MKRKEFVRKLENSGCILLRSGGKHDIYLNPANSLKQPVPRHSEIHEKLAHHIRKYLGLEPETKGK